MQKPPEYASAFLWAISKVAAKRRSSKARKAFDSRHDQSYHLQMYRPKPGIKKDPYKRWHRPDRIFFGFGACHILAGVYLRNPPLPGFHAEWIVPGAGFSGHHMYVTDGAVSFDFRGYTRRNRLLNHHAKVQKKDAPAWVGSIVRVDFDLLNTAALHEHKHLGPDQFWGDPMVRAKRYLGRIDHISAAAQAQTKNAAPRDGVFNL